MYRFLLSNAVLVCGVLCKYWTVSSLEYLLTFLYLSVTIGNASDRNILWRKCYEITNQKFWLADF